MNIYYFQICFESAPMPQEKASILFRRLAGIFHQLSLSYLGKRTWDEVCGGDREMRDARKFNDGESLAKYVRILRETLDGETDDAPRAYVCTEKNLRILYTTAARTGIMGIFEDSDGQWSVFGQVIFHNDPTPVANALSSDEFDGILDWNQSEIEAKIAV
jgi:hypothetical protein